jgi:hypothetical protein
LCTIADYWPRIRAIPLYHDRETDDGEAVLCRAQNGLPARVTKPEYFKSDAEREAAIDFLESMYSPRNV